MIQDKFDLSDRGAIVTGGAGLLGSEFCRTLAEAGARVLVADLDADSAERTAALLRQAGHTASPVSLDVTDPRSSAGVVREAVRAIGRLDVLVNCAALNPKFDAEHAGEQDANAFETYPLNAWNRALAVNLTGVFLCCQAAARPMLAGRGGSIINICSTYGLVGPDQRLYEGADGRRWFKPVWYSATKGGVLGLTRYLATYYAGTGIRVNCLTPGGVFDEQDPAFVERYAWRTVLGRMAARDDMNGALLFLASDASSYVTGANVVVDGGWTAW